MSDLPAKVEPFSPSKAPPDLIRAVAAMGGGEIVDSVMELVYLDYDFPSFTRQDARDLVSFVRREAELDEMVLAPTAQDFLEAKINRALASDLDRLLAESEMLRQIAEKPNGKIYVIEDSGEKLTPQKARDQLNRNTARMLEIKKALSEEKRAAMKDNPLGDGVNLTFNLGTVVSDGVRRIREAEAEVIDAG